MDGKVGLYSLTHNQYVDLDIFMFPGGEPHVQRPESVGKYRFGLYGDFEIRCRCNSADAFMQAMVLADWTRRQHAVDKIHLFIPYFPGARMDRSDQGKYPLTIKVYADIVNQFGFETVRIVDPHSDVTPALIDRVNVMHQNLYFPYNHLPDVDEAVLVAPDVGASKKTAQIAQGFGYRWVQGYKHRDMATGELSGFSCDPIPGSMKAIVVDDICDGGGTFLGLAKALDAQGIGRDDRYLWVTHGIFSKGVTDLKYEFGWIGSTNSFCTTKELERVQVSHVEPVFK